MGRFRPIHSIVLGSLVLAVPNVASAIDLEPYGSLYGGLSLLEDADAGPGAPDAEFDPGFVVGGALGARLVDAFTARIELDLNYRRHDVDEFGSVNGDGTVHAFGALG
ncbi:MAG TPA: hypothetical protein VK001_10355, partial [Geminicoccaceae bacterium]|nr:hypothetical protein [Geminicoccaceae bacterium]